MAQLASRSAIYLSATLASTAIAIAILPFATRVIGPSEYGSLALGIAIASLVSGFAQSAPGYILQEFLPSAEPAEQKPLVVSTLVAALSAGIASALLLMPVAHFVTPLLIDIDEETRLGIQICIVATAIAIPWSICADVLILRGRAFGFATGTVIQPVANGAVTLYFLFADPRPGLALFLGYAAGQLTLLIATLFALARDFASRPQRRWFREMRRTAPALLGARLSEIGRTLLERSYLASWAGVVQLGLFAHAQLYRGLALRGLKSVNLAVHPIGLREAKETPARFNTLLTCWYLVQAGLALTCIVFALIGRDVIGLISNDKFVGAAPFAFILLIATLIQTAAIRSQYLLISSLKGHQVANALTLSLIVSVGLMLITIPSFGAWAAALSLMVQSVIHRGLIAWHAERLASETGTDLGFREGWLVAGIVLSVPIYVWGAHVDTEPMVRIVVAFVATGIVAWMSKDNLRIFFTQRDAIA